MTRNVSKDAAKEPKGPRVRLRYLTSAVDLRGCPQDKKPEIALIGRSNAGKSSLINGMGWERVAQTSSSPGKTRLLNFYEAGDRYRYVDMPGYGYSARSGDEQRSWKLMIEPYLSKRANLKGLLILLDVRRDWSDDEAMVVEFLRPRGLPVAVILTKTDKVSKSELLRRTRAMREDSGIENVFGTSSLAKTGFLELEDFVFKNWVKPLVR